jgi:AcrR family transcriptional regulator
MATADHQIPRSLPRGRHAAARSIVLASQRGRLIEAMASCVAREGYADTTVAQVIARAGVSRKTFYEHFNDKQSCFLAAWELGTDVLIAQMVEAVEHADGWEAQVRAGTEVFVGVLAQEPDFARTFLIEVLSAGPEALERRAAIHQRFSDLLVAAYAETHPTPLPAYRFRAATGAGWEIVSEHVRTHGTDGLLALAPQLFAVYLALLPDR